MSTERENVVARNSNHSPRAGIYARVSTSDQTPDNQLLPLRAFAAARGWTASEYTDHGVSGAKERRPAPRAAASWM
jgi:DNA invertase Pin-like site-specific DNA recombinase